MLKDTCAWEQAAGNSMALSTAIYLRKRITNLPYKPVLNFLWL